MGVVGATTTNRSPRRPRKDTITGALALVMNEIESVGKVSTNEDDGYSFRGVDDVVNAVGPALRKHGVLVMPQVVSVTHTQLSPGSGSRVHLLQCVIEMAYTFHAPDGGYLSCSAPGEAIDYGDKSTSKAASVAYRTALVQAFCIPTGDPDPSATTIRRAGVDEPETEPAAPPPTEPLPPRPPLPAAVALQARLEALPADFQEQVLARISRTADQEVTCVADKCGTESYVRVWQGALDQAEANLTTPGPA